MAQDKTYRISLTLAEAKLILSYVPTDTIYDLRARDKFYRVSDDLVKSGRYDRTLQGIVKRVY